jgi:hypothetical protein
MISGTFIMGYSVAVWRGIRVPPNHWIMARTKAAYASLKPEEDFT